MKKLISMALILLMTISCMGTSFAAEVTSDGLTVDGWNGWTVADGATAVTTDENPLVGDSVERGTVVKVTGGSAERYFAQWFEGVIELSVDVYGTGTISFEDSNDRSAGTLTLAEGLVNSAPCSYDADAWNTVKLLVATGTKETEVYLGDTYVTTLTLESLVRPTKLVVSSANDIYVDNIRVSELMKTAAYSDNELTSVYTSDFAAGISDWTNKGSIAAAATLNEESVVSLTKKEGATDNLRFRKALDTEGSLVFEAELYQDASDAQTSELSIFLRGKSASTGEGRALNLVRFGKNGYIDLGSDYVDSKIFKTDALYELGTWFKIRVEVLVENQSIILYVANKDANGTYGDYVRVNDAPVRIYSHESSANNNELHTAFEELVFNFNTSSSSTALWYLKSVNLRKLADTKTETVFFEDFDDSEMTLTHYNTEGTATNYLTLTPMMEPATPNGTTGTAGQLHATNNTSNTIYVGEGTPIASGTSGNTSENGEVTKTTDENAKQEWFANALDLTDAESVTLSFDYYDAAIARDKSAYSTVRDTLRIGFETLSEDGTSTFGTDTRLNFQSGNLTVNNVKKSGVKALQAWDSASLTLSPYSEGDNASAYIKNADKTYRYEAATITKEALQNINRLRFQINVGNGGRYYLDNLKVTKVVAIGQGYIKATYGAYNTFTDEITRGNVADIAFRYVDFEDADGKESGIPTAGGKVTNITIEENAAVAAGTKLLVGVYEGDKLNDAAVITAEDGKTTYTIDEADTLSTTAASVVKVFILNMNTLVPLANAGVINDGTRRTKLVLLGDSIVADYADDEETRGWGQLLGSHVNTNKLEIENYAIPGASAADFLGKDYKLSNYTGNYEKAIDALGSGDYLMISLMTNDASRYGLDLYLANIQEMIDAAVKEKATPILVTSHPKCYYISEAIPRFAVGGNGGDNYIAWVREMERLAKKNNIPFINLYEMAADSYDTGNVKKGSSTINTDEATDGTIRDNYYVTGDHTHLVAAGADYAASLVAKGMSQLNCGIEDFVK